MARQLTEGERGKIIGLYEGGMSQTKIAETIKRSDSTVSRTIQKFIELGTLRHIRGNGRKRVLKEADMSVLKKIREENPKTSLRKSSVELIKRGGSTVSPNTIRNWNNKNNVFAYSPIKRPLLSLKAINLRMELAKNYMFMHEEDIKTIIFSDESKFNLFYSDGKVSVWREPGKGLELKNLLPTVKHGGGSIMVWGCFSYYGMGRLVVIDGKMDAVKYINILGQNLKASARSMNLENFTFQQDNDPKHTSKIAKEYFRVNNISVLPWAPQSPDLNPIETMWGIIKSKLAVIKVSNLKDLKEKIIEVWNSI